LLAENQAYIEFSYSLFKENDFNSAPIMGSVTSSSGRTSLLIQDVTPGSYQVYLSAFPVRVESGVPLYLADRPAEAFGTVKVFVDEARVKLSIFDPNGKLAITNAMGMGAGLSVFKLESANPVLVVSSNMPLFESGFMNFEAS